MFDSRNQVLTSYFLLQIFPSNLPPKQIIPNLHLFSVLFQGSSPKRRSKNSVPSHAPHAVPGTHLIFCRRGPRFQHRPGLRGCPPEVSLPPGSDEKKWWISGPKWRKIVKSDLSKKTMGFMDMIYIYIYYGWFMLELSWPTKRILWFWGNIQ